jgi:hypothetical protein
MANQATLFVRSESDDTDSFMTSPTQSFKSFFKGNETPEHSARNDQTTTSRHLGITI